jgi:hypothetical protein
MPAVYVPRVYVQCYVSMYNTFFVPETYVGDREVVGMHQCQSLTRLQERPLAFFFGSLLLFEQSPILMTT